MFCEHGPDDSSAFFSDESGRRLTAQQSSVLDHVDDHHPPRVSDLAAHMDVTEATMSIHLSRLEQGGYIRRRRDADDKRRVLLLLTPKGKRTKSENSVFDPDLVREMLRLVSPTQMDAALNGLEVLARAAEALMRKRRLNRRRELR